MNPHLQADLGTLATPRAVGLKRLTLFARSVLGLIEQRLTPLFDLAIRLYVSWQFLKSGWLKISDWESTLLLFENEYQVPVLSPQVAAIMGSGGELFLPLLLGLGLAGRFGAAGLFVVNAMAVIAYPELSELGYADHVLWGCLLLVTVFHGPGRLSLDHWLRSRWPLQGKATLPPADLLRASPGA